MRTKDGSYPKCGRSGGEKRKNYPKCVPIAKARAMSKGQRAGAVRRKQAKANTGPTPSRAATFAPKRKKQRWVVYDQIFMVHMNDLEVRKNITKQKANASLREIKRTSDLQRPEQA